MSVRSAMPFDARAIAAVHVEAWRVAYQDLLPTEVLAGLSVEARARQWAARLRERGDRTLTIVTPASGPIAGFCSLALPARDPGEPPDVGEIPALYVSPAAFGRGLGFELVEAALAAMRARGYREAILWMLGGNERAERFYRRTGWHRDGGTRGSQYFPELSELVEVRFRRSVAPLARKGAEDDVPKG